MRNTAAALVVLAGVAAALHIGKLPPALPALQLALGLTLVQAGFLLSAVQAAGMVLGLAGGALADTLGARRSLLIGLAVLAAASALGGGVEAASSPASGGGFDAATALLVLRVVEGAGFMLVALPAPGLVRRLAVPGSESAWLGLWGAYMPAATALALLFGPGVVAAWGWPLWWWALAAVSALAALALAQGVPADSPRPAAAPWAMRVRATLAAPGPWAVALAFGAYSAQWLAVIGFLPTLAASGALGLAPGAASGAITAIAALTALVAAANIVGNVVAGRCLQRGVAAPTLLAAGFVAMAAAALLAFADLGQGAALRWGAVLAFSACGGLIPATLFATGLRLAPGSDNQAATVGWMQQGSSLGQFIGPPAVAALAAAVGGWQWSWIVLLAGSAIGLLAAAWIAALLRRAPST